MTPQNIDSLNFVALPTAQVKGYGLLYNYYAYVHADFAPTGWRVPTSTDFTTLLSNAIAIELKSQRIYPTYTTGWNTGDGIDKYNFSLLPAGYRMSIFISAQEVAILASTTRQSTSTSIVSCICSYTTIRLSSLNVLRDGLSVRLVRTSITGWAEGDTIADYDGNIYDTVRVGNQIWTASNWKCTTLNTGTAITNVTDNILWTNGVIPQYCSYNNLPLIEE